MAQWLTHGMRIGKIELPTLYGMVVARSAIEFCTYDVLTGPSWYEPPNPRAYGLPSDAGLRNQSGQYETWDDSDDNGEDYDDSEEEFSDSDASNDGGVDGHDSDEVQVKVESNSADGWNNGGDLTNGHGGGVNGNVVGTNGHANRPSGGVDGGSTGSHLPSLNERPGRRMRHIETFSWADEDGQDVWNAFAVAIMTMHAREWMKRWRDDYRRGWPKDKSEPEPDPDA